MGKNCGYLSTNMWLYSILSQQRVYKSPFILKECFKDTLASFLTPFDVGWYLQY